MNESARWNKIVNRLAGQLTNTQVQLTALTVQFEELLEENEKVKKQLAALVEAKVNSSKKEKLNGVAPGERTSDASGADQPEVAAEKQVV